MCGLHTQAIREWKSMSKVSITLLIVLILSVTTLAFSESPIPPTDGYVYVAPSAYQSLAQNIYSSFGLTNLTEYWFNIHIFFVNSNGEIVRKVSPLLKGFGTWQKATVDLLPNDFQGSVWIISEQPVVSSSFIHQIGSDGRLSLLGTVAIEQVDTKLAEPLMLRLDQTFLQED
jgi:hypothetical protein